MTVIDTPAAEERQLEDGRVVAITGPVVDVEFPPHALPEINQLIEMTIDAEGISIVVPAEVAQQIGEGRVRAVCLKATDGLRRGAVARNTGRGISVPVGDAVLGHVFNVTGDPLDTDEIGEPDDVVLEGVLRKFFRERNIKPADDVYPYLMRRIERSVRMAREIVIRLDEAADAENRDITRALARQILDADPRTLDLFG